MKGEAVTKRMWKSHFPVFSVCKDVEEDWKKHARGGRKAPMRSAFVWESCGEAPCLGAVAV